MKKILKSKGFIVTSLAILCIAIVGICWYVGRDKDDPFLPDESPPASTSESSWPEPSTQAESHADAYLSPQSTEPAEEYPKVVEESENEVVIEFSDTEKTEAAPPPAPEGKTVKEDSGPLHEVNPAPEVTAPVTEPHASTEPPASAEPPASVESPASTEPEPGSSNSNGAVYDPVFGWVVPGEVNQSTIDSDGDKDKMVGNMGN